MDMKIRIACWQDMICFNHEPVFYVSDKANDNQFEKIQEWLLQISIMQICYHIRITCQNGTNT